MCPQVARIPNKAGVLLKTGMALETDVLQLMLSILKMLTGAETAAK
jgi:hypothetical protein